MHEQVSSPSAKSSSSRRSSPTTRESATAASSAPGIQQKLNEITKKMPHTFLQKCERPNHASRTFLQAIFRLLYCRNEDKQSTMRFEMGEK